MKNKDPHMIDFRTVTEKAEEWNVSPRHIQYLCKQGRIEGAVKKAGVWFIPDNVPKPVQYTKSGATLFHFVGTKKKIFDCAIELISSRGYDAVSIKDIADTVGITQSSMYNHFKSKQEILDTIYDFYSYHYLEDRPSFKEIEPILQNGSLVDIIKCVTYKFNDNYVKQMSAITGIVFYRCAIDERAKELTQSLMINEGNKYVKAVFDRAVEIGRIAPIDTSAMALFINSIKIYMFHLWMVDSSLDTSMEAWENEEKLFQYASRLLIDLKFPNET